MRIIHYLSSLSHTSGGLYYSVSGLAKAQQEYGADVSVYGGADAFFESDRHMWGKLPLFTHKIKRGGYGFDLGMVAALVRAKPDIVHIHGVWSAATIYGMIAALTGATTVVAPRGMLDPWILKRKPWLKTIHSRLLERPLLRRSLVHALSESELASAKKFMQPSSISAFVVPNGVDLDARSHALARAGALYLGRLHEKKQVLELIKCWESESALSKVRLTIAGWGTQSYERDVEAACRRSSNITFVGPAYGETKTSLFAQATFFLLPSMSEGLPMAVLEALSAGCIPVITRECNLPELINAGSAIEIASDFSDFEAVAKRIGGMSAEDAELLRDQGARQAVNYSWPKIASAVIAHYEEQSKSRSMMASNSESN